MREMLRPLPAAMTHWFYGENGLQFGPVDDAGIRQLIASGRVTPATLVWREGMPSWLPLAKVPELAQSMVPYAPYYGSAPTCGLAIASMVCGIVGFMLCYFCALLGIPAVICGHMALKQMNESPVPMSGRGMALTGLILGYLWIGLTLLAIFAVVIGAISSMP
jgi:hypothetical protein